MRTGVALAVHGVVYAFGVWLAGPATPDPLAWALWYGVGAVSLVLALAVARLRVRPGHALQFLFFVALLAVWFWGANFALDTLGNVVQVRRTPAQFRHGLPIHFILVPGAAAVALALFASACYGRRSTGPKPD